MKRGTNRTCRLTWGNLIGQPAYGWPPLVAGQVPSLFIGPPSPTSLEHTYRANFNVVSKTAHAPISLPHALPSSIQLAHLFPTLVTQLLWCASSSSCSTSGRFTLYCLSLSCSAMIQPLFSLWIWKFHPFCCFCLWGWYIRSDLGSFLFRVYFASIHVCSSAAYSDT